MPAAPPTLFDFLDDETANAEEKAAFHMRLRGRGIQDRAVLRTMELVPRALFVPHRYADLAPKDVALPIGCGQTISEPGLVAQMMEALELSGEHRVLEVGTGTGDTTAILAQLAGEVISLERFQSLSIEAGARLGQMGIDNAGVVWADGLAVPPEIAPFDRILVECRLDDKVEELAALLGDGGILIAARSDPENAGRQQMVKLVRNGEAFQETIVCACRMQMILPGLALSL